MASVIRDANGLRRVQFVDQNRSPRTLRLGRMDARQAETVRLRIERLLEARITGAMDPETARWVAGLDEKFHDRLLRLGLVSPRAKARVVTLGEMLTGFFAGVAVKRTTRTRMEQARRLLLEIWTEGREVAGITEDDALAWRARLVEDGYATATVSRTVLYARQMFRWAVRRGIIPSNPFAEVKAGSQVNKARQVFIDRETIAKVIDAAPDAEWRLLIALSRFGGLRVPSEALTLRWSDVDWANSRLTIRSSRRSTTRAARNESSRSSPRFGGRCWRCSPRPRRGRRG